MTVAGFIAEQFKKRGIRYIFGIPGGASIPYMEAFASEGIEFILTSNEASAAIMADVTARMTGIPGVCHATFGPGATNLASGVGGAFLDRSPVIALTSEMDDDMLCRSAQMNINHQELFKPLVKGTFRLTPGNVATTIETALKLCTEEYPGPVHLGLPSDLAYKTPGSPCQTMKKQTDIDLTDQRGKVRKLLNSSRSPVLAVGLTAARLITRKELTEFLESCNIPVLITPMAKGIISEEHPCYAGVLFHALSNHLEGIISKADLIIGLGYDPVELNYESWLPPDIPLIHIDTKMTDMPEGLDHVQVSGSPGYWFELLKGKDFEVKGSPQSDISSIRNGIISEFTGFRDHFGPVTVISVLQEELPSGTILTADVGSHLHLLGQLWNTHGEKNLIMTNGWSGMGFGVPAALAVQMIRKDSTVACITGDGGFLMMAGEIITAKRYNLPVIFIVMSDGELNLIRLKKSWQNLSSEGTKLYSGDLFGSTTFFGIKVINALSEAGLRLGIRESLKLREPVIINARIDPSDYEKLVVRR